MLRSRMILTAGTLCLTAFLALGTLPAMALGAQPEEPSAGVSGEQMDSGEPAEPNWTEVSSYAELKEQFKNPAHFGQKLFLRLTSDITVGQSETLSLPSRINFPGQHLDAGNFTISVEGSLTLPYQLCVSGAGGENGIFHVKEGGYLELAGTMLAPKSGYAVRQETGGIFRYYDAPELERPFPPKEQLALAGPVAWPDWAQYGWKYLPVAVVRDGDTLSEALPQTDAASVFSGGRYSPESANLPVEWDIEAYAEQFEARERFVITGHYSDIPAFAQPSCLVVFMKDNPLVFTNLRSAGNETLFSVEGYFMFEEPALTCWLEWSQDGESWSRIQEPAKWWPDGGEVHFGLDYTDIAFPLYLSAAAEGPDGEIHYSETLMLEKGGKYSDNGGNRGGGGAIDDENALPPIIDDDKPDESTSSTPDESETEDSSGSSNSSHGGRKEDSAGASVDEVSQPPSSEANVRANNVSSPAKQAVLKPQSEPQATNHGIGQTQAAGKETAQPREEPDAIRPSNPMDSEPSGAGTIPAQTHDAPKPVEMSAKAATQMAVGGALFAGVIGAGIFKPQLLRLLERLMQRLQK